ncbi:hypothetical protein DM992_37995 [Burkholderia sp. JP2-270]|uniref:DUF6875 domain-containing protein n=1 Tax=Burkholderia sp. JP2-270 TaxID=2217913 RepID=UPI000DA3F352|nr:hypothetical protein [Burkholderia sp. JP2-270]AWV05053.1 hypothetical protein DM992_37995 [Burkholderia sp. JP2-270]
MKGETKITSDHERVKRAMSEIEQSMCLSTCIDAVAAPDLRATFIAGLEWIQQFVMRPHADLGRKGVVCPFARPAHEGRALYLCAFDCAALPFDVYLDIMMGMPAIYRRLAASRPLPSDLFSLCVFPMNLHADVWYKFIDSAHALLKPVYMHAGLMLGEFHPASAVRGVRSAAFRPMRAAVPLFVIREMSLHDVLFIDRESTPLGIRIHELECYLHWVGDRLPESEIAFLMERIEQRKAELVDHQNMVSGTM